MRALIKKFNNMSIRIRLMILAALLSLMAGSIVVAVLLKNSKTAGKSADYLEHFSQISQIYELNAQNTEAIKELKKSDDEKDQTLSGQITGNINKMKVLLDEVDNEVLSSQERMRVETVQYLTGYFENSFEKYKEEYQDELYTDCMYTIDRINSFAQEILRISVEANKEYIDTVQKDNRNLWITTAFVGIMVVIVSGAINFIFSSYITRVINSTVRMTKEIANRQRTVKYEIEDEPPEVKAVREKLTAHLSYYAPEKMFEKPVRMVTKWCFPKGKHSDGEYKATKPDTDNLQKMLKDVMTEVGFWKDDALVASEITEKFWAEQTGIFISIEEL